MADDTFSDEDIRSIAVAYANAWQADIERVLKAAAPSWDQMGGASQEAMLRVARFVALTAIQPLITKARNEALREAAQIVENKHFRSLGERIRALIKPEKNNG